MTLILTSDKQMTNPLAGTPVVPEENAILYSDTFNRADGNLTGTLADGGLGGGTSTWQSLADTTSLKISDNQLRDRDGGAAFTGLPVPYNDVELSVVVRVATDSSTQGPILGVRAQSTAAATDNYAWRLRIASTALRLSVRHAASPDEYINIPLPAAVVGDRVGLRAVGDRISVIVNGVVVGAITDPRVPSGGFAGVSSTTPAQPWRVDDLIIRAIDNPWTV